jgi:orotidine-5'-phosphate decarboxylase
VEALQKRGFEVFLDLKFHDIPNTVAGAVKSCLSLDVDMLNVHATGGRRMMEAAAKLLQDLPQKPILLAVTILTSISEETLQEELMGEEPLEEAVLRLATLTQSSGLAGVVCSPLEVPKVKSRLGKAFLTVTPGIRPLSEDAGDQARVVTPAMARELGSDYIVVGRPITKAKDPVAAYQAIKKDFLGEV